MVDKFSIVSKANTGSLKSETAFFMFKAGLTFIELRQAFVIALILYYFDLECYI